MLDTNICIYIINKKPYYIFDKFKDYKVNDIVVSSITLSELEYGIEKSQHKDQNRLALYEFLTPIGILNYDNNATFSYGKIRSSLERKGIKIGPLDTLIAAHAHSLDLTIVTNNSKEFDRVDGLKVENWIKL